MNCIRIHRNDYDIRDLAALIADSTIARLREIGLDFVSETHARQTAHLIRQTIFRAVIDGLNPPESMALANHSAPSAQPKLAPARAD